MLNTETTHAEKAAGIMARMEAAAGEAEYTYANTMRATLVHATLALAAEARTANQLALAALLPPGSPMRDALLDDVHRALTEDATP